MLNFVFYFLFSVSSIVEVTIVSVDLTAVGLIFNVVVYRCSNII